MIYHELAQSAVIILLVAIEAIRFICRDDAPANPSDTEGDRVC